MAIQILPARLANQIAAGEVVERPASVVKELIENSLDAGASRIEIDIEKGGAKLIRIRDNGKGIAKEELALALSRHATSKVSTLDDLECIMSLGFRGEALASISSVARLTLTSKTATQNEAWQAMAEGRDMEVKLMPASHPEGTTLEVCDLFFNTPARRKFMRTEKTEFGHIDEVIRRIALSRFDVDWVLRHNGKQVRQYRAARLPSQQDKRLSSICGSAFIHSALKMDSEHHGLRLWGWLATPAGARSQPDVQYTYVNGRMMRDKLINHAVRQAYGNRLAADTYSAYVLYLELDATEVDVNVHPAKHEVRFHQSRLVHDFIYQALAQALEQAPLISIAPPEQKQPHEVTWSVAEGEAQAQAPTLDNEQVARAESGLNYQAPRHGYGGSERVQPASNISRGEWQGIDSLLTTLNTRSDTSTSSDMISREPAGTALAMSDDAVIAQGQLLQVIKERGAVIWHQNQLWLCDLNRALCYVDGSDLFAVWEQGLTPQPLLLPIRLSLDAQQQHALAEHQATLEKLGIELKKGSGDTIILTRVPQPLRHADLASLFPELLVQLNKALEPRELCQWLSVQNNTKAPAWTQACAVELWQRLLPLLSGDLVTYPFLQPLAIAQQLDRWINGD